MKALSTREQLECLIVALESNLESMDAYEKSCADRAESLPMGIMFAQNNGMASGAAYCAELTRRTMEAAKKQRDATRKEIDQ